MRSSSFSDADQDEATLLGGLALLCSEISSDGIDTWTTEHAKLVLFHNLTVALAAGQMPVDGLDRSIWPRGLPAGRFARRLPDLMHSPLEHSVMNGSLLMGARAQHDEYPGATSHFGSTVIPPLMTLADAASLSGRRFLEAMVAGYEVGARIGVATITQSRSRGFRPTGIYGPIAAAAACSVALNLSGEETVSAMALGANQAAGLMQVWLEGSDEWCFHTAFAARNGLSAALLSAEGVRAARSTLEGAAGYLRAYAGNADIVVDVASGLRPWAISDVLLKAYPVCAVNQAAMQQLLEIRQRESFAPGDIADIRITLEQSDADYPGVAAELPPRTTTGALMSMRYCAARAVIDGELSLPREWDLDAPEYVDLMNRVALGVHQESEPTRRNRHAASVTVTLKDGRIAGSTLPCVLKYDAETASSMALSLLPQVGFDKEHIERIRTMVFALEKCPDVSELVGLLSASQLRG